MKREQVSKEALFNEVKGSLFEYLVAHQLSILSGSELYFHQSIDKNYQNVLSQQDRLLRHFYPEMLPFLTNASTKTAKKIFDHFGQVSCHSRIVGKLAGSSKIHRFHEADLLINIKDQEIPVSLKLNRKNAFVNTKSGGVKSFFSQYLNFLPSSTQTHFNQTVNLEFTRMAHELHLARDMTYPGNFGQWVKKGFSELPGELDEDLRAILKKYYSRIAQNMHQVLVNAMEDDFQEFKKFLLRIMGFGSSKIIQVIFFHDFPQDSNFDIQIHSFDEMTNLIKNVEIHPFKMVSSVELEIADWAIQIRIKPMNKFTTTALKINCSIKPSRPASSLTG